MNDWSRYYQNCSFMNATRLMCLNNDTIELIKKWTHLRNRIKILDVGCGNGLFTKIIADEVEDCEIIGIDLDNKFITEAKKTVKDDNRSNKISFICDSGYKIPFDDNTFDLVISHTYLTSVDDPIKALSEKKRVAKKGGMVASITTQSFSYVPMHEGYYTDDYYSILNRKEKLGGKVSQMYAALCPNNAFINDVAASCIPHLYGISGLRNIEMHALGVGFSLSDASLSMETKRKFIEYYYNSEIEKLGEYLLLEGSNEYLNDREAEEYISIICQQKSYLSERVGENVCWEWVGGASLCMVALKPSY